MKRMTVEKLKQKENKKDKEKVIESVKVDPTPSAKLNHGAVNEKGVVQKHPSLPHQSLPSTTER